DLAHSRTINSSAVTEKAARINRKNEAWHQARTALVQEQAAETAAQLKAQDAAQVQELAGLHQNKVAQLTEQNKRQWQELAADWNQQITPLCAQLQAANAAADAVFPAWDADSWKNWSPSMEFQNAAKFGQ